VTHELGSLATIVAYGSEMYPALIAELECEKPEVVSMYARLVSVRLATEMLVRTCGSSMRPRQSREWLHPDR
jgi:hypothetical protein